MLVHQNSLVGQSQHIFPFRAGRDYVHSASVINFLIPQIQPFSTVTVRFIRMTKHNRFDVHFFSDSVETHATAVFDAWWNSPRGKGKAVFFEVGEPVRCARDVYNEELAIDGWRLEDGSAVIDAKVEANGFTFVDRLVALNKAYLSRIYPIRANERYVATRFDLMSSFSALSRLRLSHVRAIQETHHICRIEADGVDAGFIYYARKLA